MLVDSYDGVRGPRFTVAPGQCLATAMEWAWLESGAGAEREKDSGASEGVSKGVTYKTSNTSKSCLDPTAAVVVWGGGVWRAILAFAVGGGGAAERPVLVHHKKKSRPAIVTTAREKQLSPFLKSLMVQ